MNKKTSKKLVRAKISGTVIGLIIGTVVSLWTLTRNWDSYQTFNLYYSAGDKTKYTGYYSIDRSVDVAVYQETGNSSMKYTFYYARRGASKWTTIKSGVKFKSNGQSKTTLIGTYSGGRFRDVRIKGYKTAGTNKASKVCGYLGY